MVQYKYQCGVSGGRDLVYKDMEGLCAEDVQMYRSTKYNILSTHVLHIFVNEISSPTYTTLIFVLQHVILCSFFSSVTLSNLTMAIKTETCSEILYVSDHIVGLRRQYPCILLTFDIQINKFMFYFYITIYHMRKLC